MTSQQIVEDMGLGYNIGNTFDSLGSFIPKGDPWDYQKGWGNEPVTKHFIQKVKAAPNMLKQYEILNAMNQLFVDSVRKTGGQ